MARHASQAVLSRVIGSFGDSVKYYFLAKNRITQYLTVVIYEVLFYHIFFRCFFGFYRPLPFAFANHIFRAGFVRVRRAGFIEMIASLAALAKACKKVTLLKKVI